MGHKMGYWSIYKITCSKTPKIYIGLTSVSLGDRWSKHIYSAIKQMRQTAISAAIRKYGRDTFNIEPIFCALTLDAASEIECMLISELGTRVPNGYNITSGGEGTKLLPPKITPERNAKIAAALTGKKRSQEARASMTAAQNDPFTKSETGRRTRESWSDPTKRASRIKALKIAANTDDAKAIKREAMKKVWLERREYMMLARAAKKDARAAI